MKPDHEKFSYDNLTNLVDEGKNLGWNEALEEIRLMRYAKEESADPIAVDVLTELLGKLAKKGIA